MKRIILSITITLLMSSGAWGATVYVKPSVTYPTKVQYKAAATGCSDASGWTDDSTIVASITAADTSGVINLCSGTYVTTQLNNSTSSGIVIPKNGVTIQSASGIASDVVLDGTGLTDHIILNYSATGVNLYNITLSNATSTKYALYLGNTITVQGVTLLNNDRAIVCYSNGGGTFTKNIIKGTKSTTYTVVFSGTSNPSTWVNNQFIDNYSAIYLNAAVTATFIGNNFVGFTGPTIYNNSNYNVNITAKNNIFTASNLGYNYATIVLGGAGTWLFANNIEGKPSGTNTASVSFLSGATGATVTDTGAPTQIVANFKTPRTTARVFFHIDDTNNIADYYSLADVANNTYGWPVGIALYPQGTEAWAASDWQKLAGYITGGAAGNGSGVANELAIHSGTFLYTTAGDDAAGTVNAITALQSGTHSIVISATRTDPADSSTWSGTLTLDALASIDLASSSYDTLDEVIAYLVANGVTIGTATGQIAYNHYGFAPKSLALKAGTYDISTVKTLTFDQTSLFVSEMKDTKAYFESKIQPYIPTWTAKSFVWPGGYHGANAETYAISTAGYSQVRSTSAMSASTQNFKISSIGLGRVGSMNATDLGTTDEALGINVRSYLEALTHFGGIGGIINHGFSTSTTLAQWRTIFDIVRSTPGVTVGTFEGDMDWVRAQADHTTSNVVYRCADETGNCLTDNSNYSLLSTSPAINAGTNLCATLINSTDFAGKPDCVNSAYVPTSVNGKYIANPTIGAYRPQSTGSMHFGF